MKSSLTYISLLFFLCPLILDAQLQKNNIAADSIDVFPLTKNLHYQYSYYSRYEAIYVTFLEDLQIDSGAVDYIVGDSVVVNDTTLVWNVLQREHLWHYDFFRDTSYWTSLDTVIFLTEILNGNHELRCSSIVWSFPLQYPDRPIYRFADSSSYIISREYISFPSPSSNGVDSLRIL
jgi:hypothetical protein